MTQVSRYFLATLRECVSSGNAFINGVTFRGISAVMRRIDAGGIPVAAMVPDGAANEPIAVTIPGGPQAAETEFIVERANLRCDTNADDILGILDIRAISLNRNRLATGPNDPMDWDQNGMIGALDARGCVLACSLPRCAARQRSEQTIAVPNTVSVLTDSTLDGFQGHTEPAI